MKLTEDQLKTISSRICIYNKSLKAYKESPNDSRKQLDKDLAYYVLKDIMTVFTGSNYNVGHEFDTIDPALSDEEVCNTVKDILNKTINIGNDDMKLTEDQYGTIRKAARPLIKSMRELYHIDIGDIHSLDFQRVYADILKQKDLFKVTAESVMQTKITANILDVIRGKAILTRSDIDMLIPDLPIQNEACQ